MSTEDTAATAARDDATVVAYKNLNTNEIHLSAGPHPGLAARANFVEVPLDEVPPSVLTAARRAATERQSIADAARTRAAGGFTETGAPGSPALPTTAHYAPEGHNTSVGILSRPGMRNTQVGANPGEHPASREALLARDEQERLYPDRRGVIERGEQPAPTVRSDLVAAPVMADPAGEQPEPATQPGGTGDGAETPTTPVTITPTPDQDNPDGQGDPDPDGPGDDDPASPDAGEQPDAGQPAKAARKPRAAGK